VTAKTQKGRGVRAPLAALGAAALLFLAPLARGCCAEAAPPAIANLPAPGAYVLQRIQRTPDAMLIGADGRPAPLSAYARGAVTALAFFYAQCPDPTGCPVAWSTFESARDAAEADPLLKGRLRLLFVTLDPERDTPAVMRLLQAGEKGAGAVPWEFLTAANREELAPLLRAMGQEIAFEADEKGRRTGAIDHMLKVFLIDPEGWVREIYSTAFLSPEALLNDARTLALAFPDADNRLGTR
jgi:protein SCO1